MATTEKKNIITSTKETKDTKEMSDFQRIAILVVGDALVFLAFAAIGRRSHDEAAGLSTLWQIVLTAVPFAAGWFIVAPFVGVYRRTLAAQPRAMVIRTVVAWVLSWPVALVLRGIFVDHTVPPLSFAIVTLIANTVLLLVWRWPYALNNSLKQKS